VVLALHLSSQFPPSRAQAATGQRWRFACKRQRCTLFSTEEHVEGAGHLYIDLEFEGGQYGERPNGRVAAVTAGSLVVLGTRWGRFAISARQPGTIVFCGLPPE
jgi:hypothetical protein